MALIRPSRFRVEYGTGTDPALTADLIAAGYRFGGLVARCPRPDPDLADLATGLPACSHLRRPGPQLAAVRRVEPAESRTQEHPDKIRMTPPRRDLGRHGAARVVPCHRDLPCP